MDEFEWDEHNLAHIARHNVTAAEVEEIILGHAVDLDTQIDSGELRFTLIGTTSGGRILVVIYTEREQLLRPVTAYEPGAYLRLRYLQERGFNHE